jgi:drug/metabolite transporter (DMT)-like permease
MNPAATTTARTMLALVAFAANSVLCRLALGADRVDPASFTSIRLASGALALALLASAAQPGSLRRPLDRMAPLWLALYAGAFSFAYLDLAAGTGALILFGAVQITMIAGGILAGERPHAALWLGLLLAAAGLVVLALPGLTRPSPRGAALMALAGVAWGCYSLRGRRAGEPLLETRDNFIWAVPAALLINLIAAPRLALEPAGALLAVGSGALASGLGYVIWYAALRGLTSTRAALVQLAVPVLAALGGVVFLAESIGARLLVSAALVLSGIALATTVGRTSRPQLLR